MEIRRGDIVVIAVPGDYGKPRPALVVQGDSFAMLDSLTVLRLTSELHDWPGIRITVAPSTANGLAAISQIMVDKAVTTPRSKIGRRIGRADPATMVKVDRALASFLGLDDRCAT